jgi:hypothetical protein
VASSRCTDRGGEDVAAAARVVDADLTGPGGVQDPAVGQHGQGDRLTGKSSRVTFWTLLSAGGGAAAAGATAEAGIAVVAATTVGTTAAVRRRCVTIA